MSLPVSIDDQALSGSPVTYAGDDGQQKLQVTASQFVTTNLSGNDVFVNVVDANGVPTDSRCSSPCRT
jgi:hypothetical protein